MLDKVFFDRYNEVHSKKEKEGIPGFQMNRPLVQVKYTGRIGLELELEASTPTPNDGHLELVQAPTTKARWTGVRDGSLRGDYAREYIVTKPINRDELGPMLHGLFDVFKTMKTKLNNSNRCSTHVHLNMNNKKINEISAVICLWTVFEEAFINWCGEERKANHFAISSGDSNATLNAWENYLRYGHNAWDRNMKYSSLNVLPLFNKGSLEIRCGKAADDAETPLLWATLLDVLVDFAIDNYRYLPRMGQDISERGGAEMFRDLCSKEPILAPMMNDIFEVNGGPDAFNDSCLQGFRYCQNLVYGFPWEKWQELIEKEYIPDPFAKAPATRRGGDPVRFNPAVQEVMNRMVRANAAVPHEEVIIRHFQRGIAREQPEVEPEVDPDWDDDFDDDDDDEEDF